MFGSLAGQTIWMQDIPPRAKYLQGKSPLYPPPDATRKYLSPYGCQFQRIIAGPGVGVGRHIYEIPPLDRLGRRDACRGVHIPRNILRALLEVFLVGFCDGEAKGRATGMPRRPCFVLKRGYYAAIDAASPSSPLGSPLESAVAPSIGLPRIYSAAFLASPAALTMAVLGISRKDFAQCLQ